MNSIETRILLLVEDSLGDATLVAELLSQARHESYRVVHVGTLGGALESLRGMEVDVIVLDLHLPDSDGVESIARIHSAADQTPIVVLTGGGDSSVSLACIDAGAQDYLVKDGLNGHDLRRAIGYAISRVRESQVRELQRTLQGYRELSSVTQATTVTAALAGSGAVSLRSPRLFKELVSDYYTLLLPFMERKTDRVEGPRPSMELIVTRLGDSNGGPRDLLDIHVAALDRALAEYDDPHARTVVFEARLLALEMMGLLADYYRVGHRRRFLEGPRP